MTGFEPATTRPPDVYSTELSYIPKCGCKNRFFLEETQQIRKTFIVLSLTSQNPVGGYDLLNGYAPFPRILYRGVHNCNKDKYLYLHEA